MGLNYLIEVKDTQIEQMDAWKIFALVDNDSKLESPFIPARYDKNGDKKEVIPYQTNQKINVIPESETFFAFESFKDACYVANDNKIFRKWNTINDRLMVLPVTLFNVTAKGLFKRPSDDFQCLDGYYPVYLSKEIIVHDSHEIRKDINKKVLAKRLEFERFSFLEVQALYELTGIAR